MTITKRLLSSLLLLSTLTSLGPALPAAEAKFWPFGNKSEKNTEAEKKPKALPVPKALENVLVTGAQKNDPRLLEVLGLITGMLEAANKHDIDAFMKYYANHFMSGDNMDRAQLRGLVLETWERYPTIRYSTRLLEIRVNGSWITVDSEDYSVAENILPPKTVKAEKEGEAPQETPNKVPEGTLKTRARNLMYLHRIGNDWRIVSDQALYEDAELTYGEVEGLQIEVSAPDKVFAGQSYTAAIQAAFPPNTVAMTTINRSLMTYPHPDIQNAMRILAPSKPRRERVFTANEANRNEMVSVTLGLLQGRPIENEAGEKQGVALELGGILTVVKRVNVVPKSAVEKTSVDENGLVNYSANGKIDLRKNPELRDKPNLEDDID